MKNIYWVQKINNKYWEANEVFQFITLVWHSDQGNDALTSFRLTLIRE